MSGFKFHTYILTNINWDTEDTTDPIDLEDIANLPDMVTVRLYAENIDKVDGLIPDDVIDSILDNVTDRYAWCIKGCTIDEAEDDQGDDD
jgi:hypothetical protein